MSDEVKATKRMASVALLLAALCFGALVVHAIHDAMAFSKLDERGCGR